MGRVLKGERKLYTDTNVWISLFKEESSAKWGPVTYYAARMFEKVVESSDIILLSDLVLLEMGKKYPYLLPMAREFIGSSGLAVRRVKPDAPVFGRAAELNRELKAKLGRGIGVNDCAHFLLAKRSGAELFVSEENIHKEVGEIMGIMVIRPEEY